MRRSLRLFGAIGRRERRLALLAGALLTIAVGWSCTFSVDVTEFALVTEFGAPVRATTVPGLYAKLPYQAVHVFDARLAVFVPPPNEFLTRDKTPVVASTAMIWRIGDPRRFFETVFDRVGAQSRLADILYAELGAAVGRHGLEDFVNTNPETVSAPSILAEVRQHCADIARRNYGITILDVVLQGFDLPKQNRDRLYARMKSERARLSMAYRSEGEEEAIKIGASADEERSKLIADATERAGAARAAGEGEAARISAEAFGQAPDFYEFLRALEAARRLARKDTTMILRSDSDLFGLLLDSRRFESGPAGSTAASGAASGK
jgi:membrane protease subunit HflC